MVAVEAQSDAQGVCPGEDGRLLCLQTCLARWKRVGGGSGKGEYGGVGGLMGRLKILSGRGGCVRM